MEIELGMKVRDRISGIEGIATARTEFINGCVRISVQPKVDKKTNTLPAEVWFDDKQLEITGKGVKIQSKQTGGPTSSQVPRGARL